MPGWWILVAVPLAAGVLGGPESRTGWRSGPDLGLAALAGGLLVVLCLLLLPTHLSTTISGSDLAEYCAMVGTLGDEPTFQVQRSWAPAVLPGLLALRIGVFDALAVSAVVGTFGLGAGLYLWARAFAGRTTALAAVVLAAGLGPVVLLVRTLSFYPLLAAGFTLCAAAVAWAAGTRHLAAITLGALGAGLAMLLDLRGLAWGLPFGALTLAAAVFAAHQRDRLIAVVFVLVIGAVSWGAGKLAYAPGTVPLEDQVFTSERGEIPSLPTHYVWGRSPPWQIPGTVLRLADPFSSMAEVHSPGRARGIEARTAAWVTPWRWLVAGSAALSLVGVWLGPNRRWTVSALLVTVAPFAVALSSALTLGYAFPRHLALAAPAVALCLGLGFGVLRDLGAVLWRPRRVPVALATGLALTWAMLGPLGPWGGWQARFAGPQTELARLLADADKAATGRGTGRTNLREQACIEAVARRPAPRLLGPDTP